MLAIIKNIAWAIIISISLVVFPIIGVIIFGIIGIGFGIWFGYFLFCLLLSAYIENKNETNNN